jgi:hypothetical protein
MVSSQLGDTLRKYAKIGPGGAPFTKTKPFEPDSAQHRPSQHRYTFNGRQLSEMFSYLKPDLGR